MKIKELISELQKYDPESVVVVRGFDEGGFTDIQVIKLIEVFKRTSEAMDQTFGEYEEPTTSKDKIQVLLADYS